MSPHPLDPVVWIYFALAAVLGLAFRTPLDTGTTAAAVLAAAALLATAQATLLAIRVDGLPRRPESRAPLWIGAAATVALAALLLGLATAAVCALGTADRLPAPLAGAPLALLASQAGWTVLFARAGRADRGRVARAVAAAYAGSALELLVAVPTHVVVRRRPGCCAAAPTSAGIAVGLAVAVLAFGPALAVLFASRARHKRARPRRRAPVSTRRPRSARRGQTSLARIAAATRGVTKLDTSPP